MPYRFLNKFILFSLLSFVLVMGASIPGVHLTQNTYQKVNKNIKIELIPNGDRLQVAGVVLHYRPQGELDYTSERMKFDGFKYSLELDRNQVPGRTFEYEFSVTDRMGQTYMFAASEVGDIPFRYSVEEGDLPMQENDLEEKEKVEAVVISPLAGETVDQDDFIGVVSILNVPVNFAIIATKIYIDGIDYTSDGNIGERVITFTPTSIDPGYHNVVIQFYGSDGKPLNKVEWDFTMLSSSFARGASVSRLNGRAYINNRYEALQQGLAGSETTNNFLRGGVDLNGKFRSIGYGGRLFISSEETDRFQPINIYNAYAKIHFWGSSYFYVSGIDNYPYYNKYVLKDTRLRGVSSRLQLGMFELSAAYGSSRREISALTRPSYADSNLTEAYAYSFKREDLAARLGIGSQNGFLMGLNFYKAKDDEDTFSVEDGSTGLTVGGAKPRENLVVGTDLSFKLDNRRIEIFGNAAASIVNVDIQGGTIPYDTLKAIDPDFTDQLSESNYDLFSSFMTVNGGLVTNPGIIFDAGIKLRYFNNYFQAKYEESNKEFTSFGIQFARNDYSAIRISDGFTIMDNTLMFNLGYDILTYNKSQEYSVNTNQLNFMVGYNPGPTLPSVNFTFMNIGRSNDNPDPNARIDETFNTFSLIGGYVLKAMGANNNLQLQYTMTNREDPNSVTANLTQNLVSLSVRTTFNFPLTARLAFQKNLDDIGVDSTSFNSDFTSFLVGADYVMETIFRNWDFNVGGYGKFGNISQESFISGNVDAVRNLINGYVSLDMKKLGLVYTGIDYYIIDDGKGKSFNNMYWITRYSINF